MEKLLNDFGSCGGCGLSLHDCTICLQLWTTGLRTAYPNFTHQNTHTHREVGHTQTHEQTTSKHKSQQEQEGGRSPSKQAAGALQLGSNRPLTLGELRNKPMFLSSSIGAPRVAVRIATQLDRTHRFYQHHSAHLPSFRICGIYGQRPAP